MPSDVVSGTESVVKIRSGVVSGTDWGILVISFIDFNLVVIIMDGFLVSFLVTIDSTRPTYAVFCGSKRQW